MKALAAASNWLLLEPQSVRRSTVLGASIAGCSASLLMAAASIDNNYWLPDGGVGLFQHLGIPVILLADFLVLFLSAKMAKAFLQLAKKLPVNNVASNRRYLRRIVTRGRSALQFRHGTLQLFLFSAGLGVAFWAINANQTLYPVDYYRNDVFDSIAHPTSYVALRIILGLSWIVVYPYCAVVVFSVAANIFIATRRLCARNPTVSLIS